jgi:cytoskeletal protein CcmA (bactofilin family)
MAFFNRRPADGESADLPQPVISQRTIGFDTVIGSNCSIEGVLKNEGNARIDGTFQGDLEINGNVLIGETASIKADVHARNISIAGAVKGSVYGRKVQILRTGRVWGDINATALTTEEGAFIDGRITMVSPDAATKIAETAASHDDLMPVSASDAASPAEAGEPVEHAADAPEADEAASGD